MMLIAAAVPAVTWLAAYLTRGGRDAAPELVRPVARPAPLPVPMPAREVEEAPPPPPPLPPPDDSDDDDGPAVPTPAPAVATTAERVLEEVLARPVAVAPPVVRPVAVAPPPPVAVAPPPPAAVPRPMGPMVDVDSPRVVAVPGGPPAGFDAAKARELAPGIADMIRTRKYDYDRARLAAWQRLAGVTSDRHYGGETWGALAHYVPDAPKALFQPIARAPYEWARFAGQPVSAPSAAPVAAPAPMPQPPPDDVMPVDAAAPTSSLLAKPPEGYNPDGARKMAKQLANHLTAKKRDYARQLVRDFQRAAGIEADGIYGGTTHGALVHYGVSRPPPAMFKPTASVPYQWAGYGGR